MKSNQVHPQPRTKRHYVTTLTCSRSFRQSVAKLYPGLGSDRRLWRFLEFILVGRWQEPDSDDVIVSRDLIAAHVGVHRSKFSVEALAQEFSEKVFDVRLSDYDWRGGRARTMLSTLPDQLQRLWAEELCIPISREKRNNVLFADGSPVSDRRQQKLQRIISDEAASLVDSYAHRPNIDVVRQLNGLNRNTFTRLVKENLGAAIEAARQTDDPDRDLSILTQIAIDPKPLYKPVEGTTRFYPFNPSLVTLSRNVRKTLTSGLIEADLLSVQLQIVNKLWGVEAAWLAGAWAGWMENTGLPDTDEAKAGLKRIVYSLIFGMSPRRLHELAVDTFSERWWRKWRSHLVTKALFKARRAEMDRIKEVGYVVDAWGEIHGLAQWRDGEFHQVRDNIRRLMAQVAQSYEQRIIKAAFDASIESNEFQIVGYLYDGILIAVRDSRREVSACRKLKNAVDSVAKELGVNTTLQFRKNGKVLEVGESSFFLL